MRTFPVTGRIDLTGNFSDACESSKKLSLVTSANDGNMVTIPVMNYHLAFWLESPLEFIRRDIGSATKTKSGEGNSITT
ncbi:MAG: hypothetical protein JNM09_24085 [Blastocatellia bacterium]|nr:hypothetical protein [Blastocatellia bacterium]